MGTVQQVKMGIHAHVILATLAMIALATHHCCLPVIPIHVNMEVPAPTHPSQVILVCAHWVLLGRIARPILMTALLALPVEMEEHVWMALMGFFAPVFKAMVAGNVRYTVLLGKLETDAKTS